MKQVEVRLPHHAYSICIGPGLLEQVGDRVRAVAPHDKAAVVADEAVEGSHAAVATRSLRAAGFHVAAAVMTARETSKTLDTYGELMAAMLEARLERRSPVVAVGGGITGDTAGFVAATCLRGLPLIQCPTTLLAMVDASVGGKVGVNTPHGKNLVGAFWQPHLVVVDTLTLGTLPPRQLRCGLAECVKHGMIRDCDLFEWTGAHAESILALDAGSIAELVERNVRIKAAVVMADEREAGVRAHLNFGHTFAHAIESTTGYDRVLHGEAVSLGMVAATSLAVETGLCDGRVLDGLRSVLERAGLPTSMTDLPPTVALLDAMRMDKKVEGGAIRLVLPEAVGRVRIVPDAPIDAIGRAWDVLR